MTPRDPVPNPSGSLPRGRSWRWAFGAVALLGLSAAACRPTPPANVPTTVCDSGITASSLGDRVVMQQTTEPIEGERLTSALDAAIARAGADGAVVLTVRSDGRTRYLRFATQEAAAAVEFVRRSGGGDLLAVAADTPVRADGERSNDRLRARQWAFDQYNFEDAWVCGRGAGVRVAVVDTGVDAGHPDLGGRVEQGVAFQDGRPEVAGPGNQDPHGHGTHVAGTIAAAAGNGVGVAGVAPEATIVPVRVLDANASGYASNIAAGITWAVDQGVRIINVSVGGTGDPGGPVDQAVHDAVARGAVVVASAGNDGPGGPARMPAASSAALTVGAVDASGGVAGFSTTGPFLDVVAPGDSILSTTRGSYESWWGSSMAAPHVSGVLAILQARFPGASASWLRGRIEGTATDIGSPGRDDAAGNGRLDPGAAVGVRAG